MIKTSGMRVSPTEVEEEAYATGLVGDAVAVGVPHALLGQSIVLVASAAPGSAGDTDALLAALRRRLPRFMVPLAIEWRDALPRNANGKFDRALLRQQLTRQFAEFEPQDRGDAAGQTSRSGLEQEPQFNVG